MSTRFALYFKIFKMTTIKCQFQRKMVMYKNETSKRKNHICGYTVNKDKFSSKNIAKKISRSFECKL